MFGTGAGRTRNGFERKSNRKSNFDSRLGETEKDTKGAVFEKSCYIAGGCWVLQVGVLPVRPPAPA